MPITPEELALKAMELSTEGRAELADLLVESLGAAQFGRIDLQLVRCDVHQSLDHVGRLRPAGAAIGRGRIHVRQDAGDVDMRGRPFSRAVRRFGNDARTILRSPVALSQALGLSLSVNIAVSLCVWLIARSLAAETSALAFVFVIPVVVLVSTIPISIAGWGVREAAMVVGLGWVGMTSSAALAVSIVFGLALIAIGVVGGVVSLISPSVGGVE